MAFALTAGSRGRRVRIERRARLRRRPIRVYRRAAGVLRPSPVPSRAGRSRRVAGALPLWYNHPMSDAPKSALELVMERLRKKDAETGVTETTLTDEQRAAIAEARSVH